MTAPQPRADPRTERFRMLNGDITEAMNGPTRLRSLDRGGVVGAGPITAAYQKYTIDLGVAATGIPIRLYVLAAAQSVYRPDAPPFDIASTTRNPDQNDRSIVLVLEYGSFRYFLGGDIAGTGSAAGGNVGPEIMAPTRSRFSSTHADVETSLSVTLQRAFPETTSAVSGAPKYPFAGTCTVAKANHHGSSSSFDAAFLGTLRPKAVVVSSGVRARFHRHPTQQVIDRLATVDGRTTWPLRTPPPAGTPPTTPARGGNVARTVERVYITEVASTAKGRPFDVDLRGASILGDIVIRPTDESVTAAQAATTFGTPLVFQVYGTGAQSALDVPYNAARPCDGPNPASHYAIGPFTQTEVH
jgi:hypothetical protein